MTEMRDHQYGISRIDNDENGTRAWKVRLQRRKQFFLRLFTDGVYGGKTKALSAARKYRDTIIRQYLPLTRQEFASIKRRNNTSGVPGVCRYVDSSNGKRREFWVAFWASQPGKTKRAKFSIRKYGEKRARELAIKARERALQELDGFFAPAHLRTRAKTSTHRNAASSSAPKVDARIKRISVTRSRLAVELQDGRRIAVPLSWFPAIKTAHESARSGWKLNDTATAIVWPRLVTTIELRELLSLR